MAKTLTVSGNDYEFPENRDSAGWGEQTTAWATAVTDVLSNVAGAGDIVQSSATIDNAAVGAQDIPGFSFDPAVVRGAVCEFAIYRSANDGVTTVERVEVGSLYVAYKNATASFDLVQIGSGGSGVTLTITPAGQLQYTISEVLTGTHSGTIKFRARALTQ